RNAAAVAQSADSANGRDAQRLVAVLSRSEHDRRQTTVVAISEHTEQPDRALRCELWQLSREDVGNFTPRQLPGRHQADLKECFVFRVKLLDERRNSGRALGNYVSTRGFQLSLFRRLGFANFVVDGGRFVALAIFVEAFGTEDAAFGDGRTYA